MYYVSVRLYSKTGVLDTRCVFRCAFVGVSNRAVCQMTNATQGFKSASGAYGTEDSLILRAQT